MKRRSTALVLGGVAGSALLFAARLAIPASAADHPASPEAPVDPPVMLVPVAPSAFVETPDARTASLGRTAVAGAIDLTGGTGRTGATTAGAAPAVIVTTRVTPPQPTACCPAPSPTLAAAAPSTAATTSQACATFTGEPANVASPGIGAVAVKLEFCDNTLARVTSSQTESNWPDNATALTAMDSLVVKHYLTDISMIHFSGATLTSGAYQTSLRSALTKFDM